MHPDAINRLTLFLSQYKSYYTQLEPFHTSGNRILPLLTNFSFLYYHQGDTHCDKTHFFVHFLDLDQNLNFCNYCAILKSNYGFYARKFKYISFLKCFVFGTKIQINNLADYFAHHFRM